MNKVFSVLVLMGCLAFAQRSSPAEFVVEVTRGQDNAVPIAIVPFADPGVADVDVAQVVSIFAKDGMTIGWSPAASPVEIIDYAMDYGGQGAQAAQKYFELSPRERREVETFLKSLVAPVD